MKLSMRGLQPRRGHCRAWAIFVAAALLGACGVVENKKNTIEWQLKSTFERDVKSTLTIAGDSRYRIFVGDRDLGRLPVSYAVDYRQRVAEKTRKVSSSIDDPATANLGAILSLGIAAGFNEVPKIEQVRLEPLDEYSSNAIDVVARSDDGTELKCRLLLKGTDVAVAIDNNHFSQRSCNDER